MRELAAGAAGFPPGTRSTARISAEATAGEIEDQDIVEASLREDNVYDFD